MKKNVLVFLLGLLMLYSCRSTKAPAEVSSAKQEKPIFIAVPPDSSGITFANNLVHDVGSKANLFDFDYFYNGAGVGIGDINNDGLDDIFFCGNQVDNRLYLNKGDLQFEDISEQAGINKGKHWSNGVTFADVNNDGWLDIYVSQGGPLESLERSNLLFINEGDLTFTESAVDYGLNDKGLSTQSAFFDYDKDGDLDCIVMNESEYYGMDPIKFHQILLSDQSILSRNSSHFYEQVNGLFIDVTGQAGLLRPSFGLGLVVSDINEDGWLDFYVANDYYIPDFMMINQKGKGFRDEIKSRTSQLSFFGMGVDVADINNDAKQDIFVLDMASQDHVRSKTLMASMNVDNFNLLTKSLEFPHQYMFNSLQLNLENNRFKNIAHLTGTANTDWSWSVLMNDFDNDGKKDIYVTNGYRRYALDNDFKNKVLETQVAYDSEVPLDIKATLYEQMPSEKLPNLLYLSKGKFSFKERAEKHGLGKPSFSNGAATADLDGDGDLELVVNNIDEEAFLYKNLSSETQNRNYLAVETKGDLSESYAKVYLFQDDEVQMMESNKVRGYFSSNTDVCHFGLGKRGHIDSVRVIWPSGAVETRYDVTINQEILFEEKDAQMPGETPKEEPSILSQVPIGELKLFYRHNEYPFNDFEKEILLPYKQSSFGPFISTFPDAKKKELLFVGGDRGQAGKLFRWQGSFFETVEVPDFDIDIGYEDMEAVFFDLNGDGHRDLYIVSGGNSFEEGNEFYEDRVYLYDNGNYNRSFESLPDPLRVSGKSATAFDFDGDGDEDILVGNRIVPQSYPISGNNQILENRNGILVDVTSEVAPGFETFGIVNKIIHTDFNKDEKMDFIAVGEWTSIGMFENKGGRFVNVAERYNVDNLFGLWFEVEEVDLNKDGYPDYILGNIGQNTKFKTSREKPFKLFAHDFDTNGTLDIVLSKQYKDEYVPVRGRECSSQQMPFISEKYETYESFANATVYDIFAEQIDSSLEYKATTFSSMALVSQGGQGYRKVKLPIEAQFFSLLDCEVIDINGDGQKELFLAGNIYDTEVETPRWDAGTGTFLTYCPGQGVNEFCAKTLQMQGDIKDLEWIRRADGTTYLIAAKNNDLMSVYRIGNDY